MFCSAGEARTFKEPTAGAAYDERIHFDWEDRSGGSASQCVRRSRLPFATTDNGCGDWAEWPDDLHVREMPAAFFNSSEHLATTAPIDTY
jgi:hypothetical protein